MISLLTKQHADSKAVELAPGLDLTLSILQTQLPEMNFLCFHKNYFGPRTNKSLDNLQTHLLDPILKLAVVQSMQSLKTRADLKPVLIRGYKPPAKP